MSKSDQAWLRVSDRAAARMLADPAQRQWLAPFMGAERTVSDVARELGVPVNAVLYRTRRLVDRGLVEVVGEQRRRGRPMQRYRAAGDGFVVPVTALPAYTLEALLALNEVAGQMDLTRALASAVQSLAGSVGLVMQVGLDEAGNFSAGLARDGVDADLVRELTANRVPAVWSTWSALSLGKEDAKALQRELAAMWAKYHRRSGSGPGSYTLRLALVPIRRQ